MNQFTIYLPVEEYNSSDFGTFYVQSGDYYFPSKVWTDFGVKVVFDWMNKLSESFSNQEDKIGCKFMDGNYRFDLEKNDSSDIVKISFIKERGNSDEIEYEEEFDSKQFLEEILKSVRLIQNICQKDENYKAVERMEDSIQNYLKALENYVTISDSKS